MVVVGLIEAQAAEDAPVHDEEVGDVVGPPQRSTTDVAGSSPIRAVPIRCQPVSRARVVAHGVGPRSVEQLLRPR